MRKEGGARICFGIPFSPKKHRLNRSHCPERSLFFIIVTTYIINADYNTPITVSTAIHTLIITPITMVNHYTHCNSTIRAGEARKLRHPKIP